MIEFRKASIEHLRAIRPQASQRDEFAALGVSEEFIDRTFSLSAWAGVWCVGAAGLYEVWPGRAQAWALVSDRAGPYMVPLVRKMRGALAVFPYPRVEMVVDAEFANGHRLAAALGFEVECQRMRRYLPNGNDATLYVRAP